MSDETLRVEAVGSRLLEKAVHEVLIVGVCGGDHGWGNWGDWGEWNQSALYADPATLSRATSVPERPEPVLSDEERHVLARFVDRVVA